MDNEIAAIQETSKMTNQSEKSKISGLGARLKKTRESMHLTQKEAAARLYLNPKIVEVIENEAFFDGPPLTFMRGYLRSYARLLNFPESEIKNAIDELELNSTPTALATPTLQTGPIYRGDRYIRWITYLIILTLVSLVVVWWSSHSKYVIADVPATNSAATQVKTNETVAPAAVESTNNTATTTTATEPQIQAVPPTKTEPTVTATPVTPAANTAAPQPAAVQPPAATVAPEPVTPPPATTETPSSVIPPIVDPTATTLAPGAENPANAMFNNNTAAPAPIEQPAAATHHKKRHHKRHQYRPIENMDIPEPD